MTNPVPGLQWFPGTDSGDGIDHGCLTVPACWDRPLAHEPFELPVVRYRARVANASRAVIFLAGGPGESGLSSARHGPVASVIQLIREWADVVTLDQRGTGLGRPALPHVCDWQFAPSVSLSREAALARAQELGARCADHWRGLGVDPNAFNITRSAADVGLFIDSLGYQGISLLGTSYGTQLGLSVLRTRPDLEAAVLLNVEAPHQTVKSPRLVEEYLLRGLQALSDAPVAEDAIQERLAQLIFGGTHEIELPGVGAVSLGQFELQRGISRCLGSRSLMTRLANSLLDSPGDFLLTVGSSVSNWKAGAFDSLQLVVDSATGISATRLDSFEEERRHSLLGDAVDFPLPYVRRALGIDDIGESGRNPVATSVPVLFVSGELDARTPPDNVADIIGGFDQARHLVVPLGLHEPEFYFSDNRIRGRVNSWLRESGE